MNTLGIEPLIKAILLNFEQFYNFLFYIHGKSKNPYVKISTIPQNIPFISHLSTKTKNQRGAAFKNTLKRLFKYLRKSRAKRTRQ